MKYVIGFIVGVLVAPSINMTSVGQLLDRGVQTIQTTVASVSK